MHELRHDKIETHPERPLLSHRVMRAGGIESSHAVKVALDTAWGFGAASCTRRTRVTTNALWLALAAMARKETFPSSRTLAFLRLELAGRWIAFDRELRELENDDELEAADAPALASTWSKPAHRVMRLARMLAAEEGADALIRLRHLLYAILLQPALPEPPSAHRGLARVGLDAWSMRRRFERVFSQL